MVRIEIRRFPGFHDTKENEWCVYEYTVLDSLKENRVLSSSFLDLVEVEQSLLQEDVVKVR